MCLLTCTHDAFRYVHIGLHADADFRRCRGAALERLTPEVLSVRLHDPNAFTQRLLFFGDVIFESVGRHGQSSLRKVTPCTGEVLR